MSAVRIILAASLCMTIGAAALAQASSRTVNSDAGPITVTTIASGLEHPWALAFLPDGRMLVTERPGRLRLVDEAGAVSQPISGLPQVFARGQGGLLDIALAPDFASSGMVYFSFAEPGDGNTAGTAVGRGRLDVDGLRLGDVEVIFRQQPKVTGGNHFGGRLAFAQDGTLFLTMADRFKFDPAQDPSNTIGTVVRLTSEGKPAPGNPFAAGSGRSPEIWSYGHRNIQAAAIRPGTSELWIAEMGPRNGDELNQPQAGRNYGWPLVSWGQHYDGRDIPDPSTRPDLADAAMHWTPVISPSGMVFYTGDRFPEWRGSMLIGGLGARGIVRVTLQGGSAKEAGRVSLGARIRDVRQGPDGAIYVLTDENNGRVLKLTPAE
jgi:aldose sugar dehydrogenase